MAKSTHVSILLATFVVLVLLAAFVAGFYFLVTSVGVQASLVWSALIAGIGWMISEHISRRREHEKLLAEQKRQMYFEFLDVLLSFVTQKDDDPKISVSDDVIRSLTAWSLKLGIVGSDSVVRAWNAFRTEAGTRDTSAMFRAYADLLIAMRRDCWHFSTALKKTEILALLVKAEDLKALHSAIEMKP